MGPRAPATVCTFVRVARLTSMPPSPVTQAVAGRSLGSAVWEDRCKDSEITQVWACDLLQEKEVAE